jgi:opacity protein-like surface antigen
MNRIIVIMLFFWTSNLWAEFTDWQDVRPMASITGGAAFVSGLDSTTDFTLGLSEYDYVGNDDDETRAVFGAFLGAEFALQNDFFFQLGAAYYQFSNLPVQGNLTQGFDASSSDEYHYEYSVTSYQALLEAKLLVEWAGFYPYISAGAGAVFNHGSDYDATLTSFDSCQCSVTPSYDSYTHTSFSYNVGAGIDYDILPYLRLGVGYRYTDLGEAQIGQGELAGTEFSETLNSVDIQAQQVIAQLTYFTE